MLSGTKSEWTNVGLWILQVGAAGMFLLAGSAKLSGDPMMVGMFEKIAIGQWFRILTGTLEVLGAIGLLTPFASGIAAAGLVPVMAGAVLTHLVILGGNPTAALVLLIASSVVVYGRSGHIVSLLRWFAK